MIKQLDFAEYEPVVEDGETQGSCTSKGVQIKSWMNNLYLKHEWSACLRAIKFAYLKMIEQPATQNPTQPASSQRSDKSNEWQLS